MIIIDATTINLKFVAFDTKYVIKEKYRLNDGTGREHREIIGVFEAFDITFGPSIDAPEDYILLINKLIEEIEYHTIQLPTVYGDREIEGRFEDVDHGILKQIDDVTYWDGLSLTFVAREKMSVV